MIYSAKISKGFTFCACGHNIQLLLSHIKGKLLLPLKLDIHIIYHYDFHCRMKNDKSQPVLTFSAYLFVFFMFARYNGLLVHYCTRLYVEMMLIKHKEPMIDTKIIKMGN